MNLNIFNTDSLFNATTHLFEQLGIKLNSNTTAALPLKDLLKGFYKDNDLYNSIKNTYFIGIIDDTVFQATGMFDVTYDIKEAIEQGDKNYEGLMLFALELSKKPTRTEISGITRAFNRISQKMPVALLLKYSLENEAVFSIALSERFKYLQAWRQGEKAGKVIILKDIHTKPENTHTGHKRILLDLVKPAGVTNYAKLHAQWLEVLDINILNKKFFQELANWYFWAMDKVQFPDDIEKKEDVRNATNLIRLITRVIFIWFIKEKHLVPSSLFSEAYLSTILKDFLKNEKSGNYYQAILQNLFFGTLNQKMDEREFAEDHNRTNKLDQGVKNKYRYPEKFNIAKDEIMTLFKDIPFLNGGLFDCFDKFDEEKLEKGKKEQKFVDGFTRLDGKQAIVPDFLFFADPIEVDLNEVYGTRNKRYLTKGLINLLNSYKFTVAESTPIEEEIALDPELLGKVFENLLASYNPETQTTARKQTGSFYTPREIVNFMVDESLIEYLKQNTQIKTTDIDSRLRNLFAYNDEVNPFNSSETDELIEAINNAKILDPACGSGAFPMGVLLKMVHLLQKLDPGNGKWKAQQREKIIGSQIKELENDRQAIAGLSDKAVREKAIQAVDERLKEIDKIFESKNYFDDYARKLFLIENCIYGIDLQPIAVQISKLRFFISLIIDQDKDTKKGNLGFRSLPNLETKFVAANTLIGLEIPTNDLFSENNPIKILQEQLKATRHEYFNARTRKDKLSLQQQDKALRKKIAAQISDTLISKKEEEIYNLEKQLKEAKIKLAQIENEPELKETIVSTNLFGQSETTIIDKKREKIKAQKSHIALFEKQINSLKASDNKDSIQKVAEQISSFDPYDQNHFANWFEPEWMFGNEVKDGFDIVIGNPPYYLVQDREFKEYLKRRFKTMHFKINLFACFIEQGIYLLKEKGILSYINPNLLFANDSFKLLREMMCKESSILFLMNLGDGVFENVTMPTMVFLLKRISNINNEFKIYPSVTDENLSGNFFISSQRDVLNNFNFVFETINPEFKDLIEHIYKDTVELETVLEINQGIITGNDSEYLSEKKVSEIWKPTLRGRDIECYKTTYPALYVFYSPEHLACPRTIDLFEAPEKLVMRRTGDFPVVSYDNQQTYNLHTLYSCRKNGTLSIKFLLALLNSKLLRFAYIQKMGTEAGRIFAEIKILYVRKLPVKLPYDSMPFITIVDQILTAKKINPSGDTSALEKQIDQLVYQLYNLTEEEIKIIEGEAYSGQ